MFIQKKASPIFLALLCMVPVSAMAATQVLSTYKNAPNPTILANLGVPADSQMAQQALARQIAVQAASMQQTNPALVGSVITGDTASVPYNGYQASSLKTGFGYQQPANGDVLFADLINVLPTAASATPLLTPASAAATNNSAAPQSNSSGGLYYSSTAANAVVQSLPTDYKPWLTNNGGGTVTLLNGMTVTSNPTAPTTPLKAGQPDPTTYSITYGSGQNAPVSTGLTASQAAAILQGGSVAANAIVQSLPTDYKPWLTNNGGGTATLPNGMTVTSNPTAPTAPLKAGQPDPTTYSITYGSGQNAPVSTGLTASQAAAILSSSIPGVGSVSPASSSSSSSSSVVPFN